jgi:carboxylate-amine ligase
VSHVHHILEHGTGADRQLRIWNRRHDLRDVVDYIVAETHAGLVLG